MTPRPVFASDSESDEDVIRPSAKKKLTAGKKVLVRADALGSSNSDAEEEEVAAAKPNEDEEQADNVGDVDKSGSEDNKDDEDKEDDKDDKEGDGQEGEDEDEDKDDEVFTVEAIMDHRFGGKNNKEIFFHVKWENYPNKKDWTWEPEENLKGGSDEILQSYFEKLGGRPQPKSNVRTPASSRKRRNTQTPAKSSTKKLRTSTISVDMQDDSPIKDEATKWKPPAGSWENEISHIDTIERISKGLVCYVQWVNGRKSQHDLAVLYKKCPQRMLAFYEQHLMFKESN